MNMCKSLIIHPEHMIHELGLKGVDLLIYAFIFSVYNLTEKSVKVNKTYLSNLFGYSRRQVIKAIDKMVYCGSLVKYGESYVPAYFMSKGHSVKKVHISVKKVHINDKYNDNKKENTKEIKNESLLKKKYEYLIEIAKTAWLEDY